MTNRLMLASVLFAPLGCIHASAMPIETVESFPVEGIHMTSRVVFYAIRGRTLHDLRSEMQRIGPIEDGKHQFASTWSELLWRYPYDRTAAGCAIGPVNVELQIVQTFPARISRDGRSAQVDLEWDRWLAATHAHEDRHREISLETARELITQLHSLPSLATCEEVDRAAAEKGNELLRTMRLHHAELDRLTEHGRSTGAYLRDDVP